MQGHILIVEDEKKIADTLNLGLTEQGYEVEVAYDGKLVLISFLRTFRSGYSGYQSYRA